jgi:very-short-patch-repair endonuclease
MSDASTQNSALKSLVLATIHTLRTKLLDLTMANRLLNFKPSEKSRSHIRIIDEIPEALFESLEAGKEMEFRWIEEPELDPADERTNEFLRAVKEAKATDAVYIEQLEKLGKRPSRRQISTVERGLRDRVRESLGLAPRVKPSVADRARELGIDPSYDLPLDGSRSRAHPDLNVQTLLYRETMEAKLAAIRESDKTLLDDAGVNALYAAFGAIEWYESADSNLPVFAPLVFVPVEIRRVLDDGVYRYVLFARDEDIEINQAFAELARETHSLELPPWDPEATLGAYFEHMERLLESRQRWRLRRWVTVGLFTFAKMAMYRDLDTKRWSTVGGLETHSILNDLLAGTEVQSEVLLAGDYEIDAPAMDSKVQPLVTDADSSQHSAVIDVCDGKNLVIEGPPGTGKSQTITNIIAAAMSSGKRVLFVAEKMAALKVVKDRLDSFSLGSFCLEVHSNKTRKTAVLKSFEDRLNLTGSYLQGRQLQQSLEAFEQARQELIHYVKKMKEEVGETGLTIHEVLRANSIRTPLGEALPPGVRKARIAEPTQVSPEKKNQVMDLAGDLEVGANHVDLWGGLSKHPWRGVQNQDLDYFGAEELESELKLWREALGQLQEEIKKVAATGWSIEETPEAGERFVIQALALPKIPEDVQDAVFRESATDTGRALLAVIARDLERLVSLEKSLTPAFEPQGALEGNQVSEVESVASLARDLRLEQLEVEVVPILADEREHTADRMTRALPTVEEFAKLFGIDRPNVLAARSMRTATVLLSEIPENAFSLREPAVVAEGSTEVLERGSKQAEALRALKSVVTTDFEFAALPPVAELRNAASILENTGFFARIFGSAYREARRVYQSIAQKDRVARKRSPSEELTRLVQFLQKKHDMDNDTELRRTAGTAFRGTDTRWQELVAVSRWAAKVRRELPGQDTGNKRCREVLLLGETAKLQKLAARSKQGLDALTMFEEPTEGSEQSVETLAKSANTVARLTSELALRLNRLRLARSIHLGNLRDIAMQLGERKAVKERLDAQESRRILAMLPGAEEANTRVLGQVVEFAKRLAELELPEVVRREMSRGSAREIIDRSKTQAASVREALNGAANHKRAVVQLSRLDSQDWIGHPNLDTALIEALEHRIEYALMNREAVQPYLEFLRMEDQAKSSALGPLLKYFESSTPPYARLREAYDFIFYRSCAEAVLLADPMLRSHSGIAHEQLRKRYQQLDRKIMELRRLEIVEKLMNLSVPAGVGRGRSSEKTELALIRHQISLQRRHATLRDLFRRAGAAAQALKPCFMMSPMSVAQFLDPGGIRFDLVVMDEASQIRPEDALGAIVRGKQVVVVGDPKQLPPTSFFEKVDRDDSSEENSEEADIHDLTAQESILALARGPYQPVRQLRWHYRSQHEKLIAFSNHEFYQDSLIVFPSPKGEDADYGVRYVAVEGIYEAGLNRIEAETVTESAQTFMSRFPERSLGIVAMNKPQQELIQSMMDELFATDAQAESYRQRWENTLNALFVKNLENVQGDERDVIFISTVYGKDAAGNFFQRLGPINGVHGHRRLNVLFTRAKQQVCLFTSMRANDLRIEDSTRWGVKALKNYLIYAQTGHLDTSEFTGREPDSEFERWVMELLQEAGYEVVPQLGVAGYFIDLAVRHPEQNGAFLLGIECDGATYHSARSVRDRDRLRQEVLERLKWNIYRIWSTDWFRNPRAEFQKLTATLESLRGKPRPSDPKPGPAVQISPHCGN